MKIHYLYNNVLQIPFVSQCASELRNPTHGLTSEEIAFGIGENEGLRTGRLCGLASVMMAIGYLLNMTPLYKDFIAYAREAYSFFNPKTKSQETRAIFSREHGWAHGGLIFVAGKFGLEGEIVSGLSGSDQVWEFLKKCLEEDGVFLASVSEGFVPKPGEQGGHIVVMTGLASTDNTQSIIIHDPAKKANTMCDLENFLLNFGGNGILIQKKSTGMPAD